jgi:hypothetical protein
MPVTKKNLRKCKKGHTYYKSSDCPVCPVCAEKEKPIDGFLSKLSAPARRALQNIGATTPKQLATHTEAGIMALHGMGPSTLPKLLTALKESGLSFKKQKNG